MTAPLIVDPNEVNGAAAQWYELVPHFDAPPPPISGGGPESLAAQQAVLAAQAATGTLQQGLSQTAGTAHGAANTYATQEGHSAGSLKDATGPVSDIAGVFGTAAGAVVPFATEAVSFGGQMISTATSSALQITQQVTSALRGSGGASSAAPPGVGIGLPPADQDQHSPEDHTATAAAPAAENQEHTEHEGVRSA